MLSSLAPTPSLSVTRPDLSSLGMKAVHLDTVHGPAHVVRSARDISEKTRFHAMRIHAKDLRFYEILEETLPQQFEYRYFVLENALTGDWAIQPFFFVTQDLVVGLPFRFRKVVGQVRKLWPRCLKLKMMMIGCAAAEGQLDSAEPWAVEALQEVIEKYARLVKTSLVLLKDFPASYRAALSPFSKGGYRRVPSMPAATLDLNFTSFDDYLQNKLSKVFRKNLRRKFREASASAPLVLEVVTNVTSIIDEVFPLYLQTYSRSQFHFEKLTPEYFCEIGQRMPDRVHYFLWRQNGRLVAFSLCLVHEGVLYDLDVGMDYSVALDLHLYFVTLRDILQWAINQGLKTYHTGPLNYDPKLHLKLDLAPLDLYARHMSRWINPIFKIAIAYLEPTRHDPVLARFHNAFELR
ncbi:MAG: hypothetical protein QOD99_2685 [Chthoniobacter sp.]|nr:hypothetical protein [Chthoniobacter sp.]